MEQRRVAVTGLGIVSPIGSAVPQAWDNLVAGRSGIRRVDRFDASQFPVQICGSVVDFDVDRFVPAKDQKKMDVFIQYAIGATAEAVRDAGLEVTEETAPRVGVAIGSGIGGLPYIESSYEAYMQGGPRRISPFFVPSSIVNMASGDVSIQFDFKGHTPNRTPQGRKAWLFHIHYRPTCHKGDHALSLSVPNSTRN